MPSVGTREDQRRRHTRATAVRDAIGSDLRGLRIEAGLTGPRVAAAAGISIGHLSEIERGRVNPSIPVLVAVAEVLGADLSIKAYPNTGPRIHDRFQAPIVEELIRLAGERWRPYAEVGVYRPARGSIDLVLAHRTDARVVPTEVYSEIRRLEQQIRWAQDKVASLPSSDLWRTLGRAPEVSPLLVIRSTAHTRDVINQFMGTIGSVYPARPKQLYGALVGEAPWPGAGLLWARIDRSRVTILDGPPRGVRFGR